MARNSGEHFFTIQYARDVGEINQLVGTEKFRARRGHVIRVDVVKLVVRADAKAGSHRHEPLAPERFDEGQVQACQIADEAEAAFHFVVHHGLGEEAAGIRGGDSDGGLTLRGNGGGHFLVEQAGENHDGGVACFAVRDAQAADKLALDGHALQRGGEKLAAAVHHEDLVTLLRQRGNLAREFAHCGVVFQQCSSKFDYDSH